MALEPDRCREPVDDPVDAPDARPVTPTMGGDRDPAIPDGAPPTTAWSSDADEDDEDDVFSFALEGSDREPVESTRFGLRTHALADGARDELDAMAAADALAALEAVPTSPTPTATGRRTSAAGERAAPDVDELDDHLSWALDKAREAGAAPAPTPSSVTGDAHDDPGEVDDDPVAPGARPVDDGDEDDDAPATFSIGSPVSDDEPPADETEPPTAPPAGSIPTPEHDDVEDDPEQPTPAADVAEQPGNRPAPLAAIWDVPDDDGPSAWDAFATGELEGRAAVWDESTVRPGGLPERDWEALATAGSGDVDGAAWRTLAAEATPEAPDDEDWESAVDSDAWPDHGTVSTVPHHDEDEDDDEVEAFLMQVTSDGPLDAAATDAPGDEDEPVAAWSLGADVHEPDGDDGDDLGGAWSFGTYADDGADDVDLDHAWEQARTTAGGDDFDLAAAATAPEDEHEDEPEGEPADEPIEGLDDDLVFSFSVADVDDAVTPTTPGDPDDTVDTSVGAQPAGASATALSGDDFSALLEATAEPSALEVAARLAADTVGHADVAPDDADPVPAPPDDDPRSGNGVDTVGAMAHLDALEGLDSLDGLDGLGGLGGFGDLDLDWLDGDADPTMPVPPVSPPPADGAPPPPPTRPGHDTPSVEPIDDDATPDDEDVASTPVPVDLGNFSAGRSRGGRRRRGLFGR